jgi:YD repeat-containing protein
VSHIETDVKDPEGVDAFDGDSSGSVTDPNGKTTSFVFTQSSPWSRTDPDGNVTQYRFIGAVLFDYMGAPYQSGSLLVEAIFPEGNKYQAEYGGPFKSVTKETLVAKPGSGLPNLVKQYGYGSCFSPGTYQTCPKPIWIKDPKGNQTDYAYASWGGMLSEMQPAPASGAARPLKLYTYVQKYAYVKNSGGALVAAATPIWLMDTETICQTVAGSSAAACDSSAPSLVTTYLYGANGTADNLLVRGKLVSDGTTSLRTCFTYDSWSRKISETSPRAGLSSC